MPADRFRDQVAVVTGGASGIGAATAARLAAEGAAVVIADVAAAGADVAASLENATFVQADVADEDAWGSVVATAQRIGPVNVLVSNAYARELAPAHEMSRASWDHQLAVCLTATFLGVRACLPDLRATRGSVVVTSSVHALAGLPGNPAYAAAKGGLTALARQLAVEYGPEVRVSSVLPGPILTAAWDGVNDADRALSIEATVAKRLGDPAEVAAAIAFLASRDASYITGASLVVDGGWSIAKASV